MTQKQDQKRNYRAILDNQLDEKHKNDDYKDHGGNKSFENLLEEVKNNILKVESFVYR